MFSTHLNRSRQGTSVVSLTDICVHRRSAICLAPCSVNIRSEESIALVGANGSGKTTLLHVMAGILEATDGTVEGQPKVAFVAQEQTHHSWMPMSVEEVLKMGRYRGLFHRLRAEDRIAVDSAAERLGVGHLRHRRFSELSGGERQRVLVARAVAASAELLLLDEPITGLDLPSQEIILEVIDAEAARGAAVVFSTHQLAEARHADRVILLAGCVLADGSPDSVLTPGLLAEAFGGRLVSTSEGALVVDEQHHGSSDQLSPQLSHHLHHHDQSHHEHSHEDNGMLGRGWK
jgi:ABC-type Mn2+/Zn2+ transport system ATPase subunit